MILFRRPYHRTARIYDRVVAFFVLVVVLSSLSVVATAESDTGDAECATYIPSQDRSDSQTLTMHGVACFEAGQYDWALTYYLDAYNLHPEPFLLGGIGRSLQELGLYQPALNYYQDFLSQDEVPSGADRIRTRVQELEASIADDTATVALQSSPPGAEAFVVLDNGQWYSVGTTPVELEVRPGHYQFVFDDDHYRPRHRPKRVVSHRENMVEADLVSEQSALDISQRNRRRTGVWTMGGSLIPAAAGTSLLMLSIQETSAARRLEDEGFDDLSDFDARRKNHLDNASTYRLWGTLSSVIGATGLLTGAVLFFSTPRVSTHDGSSDSTSDSSTDELPQQLSRNLDVEPTVGLNHFGFRLHF